MVVSAPQAGEVAHKQKIVTSSKAIPKARKENAQPLLVLGAPLLAHAATLLGYPPILRPRLVADPFHP